MDQSEIIHMAREAGWEDLREFDAEMRDEILIGNAISLERFANLVAEATKANVYQAIRDAETPYTQLTLGQQKMIKEVLK